LPFWGFLAGLVTIDLYYSKDTGALNSGILKN
jgi:hypothetical protein